MRKKAGAHPRAPAGLFLCLRSHCLGWWAHTGAGMGSGEREDAELRLWMCHEHPAPAMCVWARGKRERAHHDCTPSGPAETQTCQFPLCTETRGKLLLRFALGGLPQQRLWRCLLWPSNPWQQEKSCSCHRYSILGPVSLSGQQTDGCHP